MQNLTCEELERRIEGLRRLTTLQKYIHDLAMANPNSQPAEQVSEIRIVDPGRPLAELELEDATEDTDSNIDIFPYFEARIHAADGKGRRFESGYGPI